MLVHAHPRDGVGLARTDDSGVMLAGWTLRRAPRCERSATSFADTRRCTLYDIDSGTWSDDRSIPARSLEPAHRGRTDVAECD